jgi:hypothetical protein
MERALRLLAEWEREEEKPGGDETSGERKGVRRESRSSEITPHNAADELQATGTRGRH